MSMNLIFEVKGGSGMVDFPFQTPTDLTYTVIKAQTPQERITIIREKLTQWEWDNQTINKTITEIQDLMNNSNLILTYI